MSDPGSKNMKLGAEVTSKPRHYGCCEDSSQNGLEKLLNYQEITRHQLELRSFSTLFVETVATNEFAEQAITRSSVCFPSLIPSKTQALRSQKTLLLAIQVITVGFSRPVNSFNLLTRSAH